MHKIKYTMKKYWIFGMAGFYLVVGVLLVSPAMALESYDIPNPPPQTRAVRPDTVPRDSSATVRHWKQAKVYQRGSRYELARQEYLMALANCRTEQTKERIQRELQIVDLQIRTLR